MTGAGMTTVTTVGAGAATTGTAAGTEAGMAGAGGGMGTAADTTGTGTEKEAGAMEGVMAVTLTAPRQARGAAHRATSRPPATNPLPVMADLPWTPVAAITALQAPALHHLPTHLHPRRRPGVSMAGGRTSPPPRRPPPLPTTTPTSRAAPMSRTAASVGPLLPTRAHPPPAAYPTVARRRAGMAQLPQLRLARAAVRRLQGRGVGQGLQRRRLRVSGARTVGPRAGDGAASPLHPSTPAPCTSLRPPGEAPSLLPFTSM